MSPFGRLPLSLSGWRHLWTASHHHRCYHWSDRFWQNMTLSRTGIIVPSCFLLLSRTSSGEGWGRGSKANVHFICKSSSSIFVSRVLIIRGIRGKRYSGWIIHFFMRVNTVKFSNEETKKQDQIWQKCWAISIGFQNNELEMTILYY